MKVEEQLAEVPLFAELDVRTRRRLAQQGLRRTYVPGEYIIKQGDQASAFYVVLAGNVSVEQEVGGTVATLTELGPPRLLRRGGPHRIDAPHGVSEGPDRDRVPSPPGVGVHGARQGVSRCRRRRPARADPPAASQRTPGALARPDQGVMRRRTEARSSAVIGASRRSTPSTATTGTRKP